MKPIEYILSDPRSFLSSRYENLVPLLRESHNENTIPVDAAVGNVEKRVVYCKII